MKKIPYLYILIVSLISPNLSLAGIDLPWSTTYGSTCKAWTQGMIGGGPLNTVDCDGITEYGGWYCDPAVFGGTGTAQEEEITTLANNPGGPDGTSGKGQRHWIGDGKNRNSGGLWVGFNTPQTEIWVRWYMRFEKGFKWIGPQTQKWLYIYHEDKSVSGGGTYNVGWRGADSVEYWVLGDPKQVYISSNFTGWDTLMGKNPGDTRSLSDGQWHSYEIHTKIDTDGTDGVAEMWIDGKKVLTVTTVDFITAEGVVGGWEGFILASNQSGPDVGKCMYLDYDDIAVSNTGYIGPLPNSTKPGVPTNLQAK